jgi:hypothetical protein
MPHSRRKAIGSAAIAFLAAILMPSAAIAAESIVLAGTYPQEEIKLKCESTGGRYFEDVEFGDYGCRNEGRRNALKCNLITLKCTLRLPDGPGYHASLPPVW